MYSYVFEGEVVALSSISHIGETVGINAKLRREKFIQPDGRAEEIPVISGNSIRGLLRDRGMLHMLKMLGYGVNERTGEITGLPLAAFYFLFSGGALSKGRTSSVIDVSEARRWRTLIPLVSIFGGAVGNQIMPGRLKVDKLIPICQETAHLLPERFVTGSEISVWDCCQIEAYTRKDDEKDERLRYLIEAGAAQMELMSRSGGDIVEQTGQKQQMRYYVETLAAGTRFFWSLTLDDVTPVELDAFWTTLVEFARKPYVGGRSSVGHGKIAVQFDKWFEINPRLAPQGREVDFSVGQSYMQHLRQNADEIRSLLNDFV